MKKSLIKNSFKEISKTKRRFLSILIMAFLGVGFYAGLVACSPDMQDSLDKYVDKSNMYDIDVISTLGLTNEDINAIKEIDGVENAYGIQSKDTFINLNDNILNWINKILKYLNNKRNDNQKNISSCGYDIKNTIKIRSDKGFLGKLLPANKQLIQLDSQEFEKLFDVYSTDKILALRILTSDILDYMINFKKENKIKYELTLKNSSLYIRIHCKDMFEAPFSKDSLDFDTLHMYYKIIHFVCELNRKFYHTVEGKDI